MKSLFNKPEPPLLAALVLSLVILVIGWRLFWFMTDDAYIAFRYVSNSVKGYGFVWNPPPFRPVEGYTSFLWIVILDFFWRLFGIEPPRIANWLLLGFSCLNLIAWAGIADFIARTRGCANSYKRAMLVFSALLGIVLNTTFLAWSSSGLETALFNFLVSLWVGINIHTFKKCEGYIFSVALVSSLIYLTRPDGMVYVGISFVLSVHAIAAEQRGSKWRYKSLLAFAPFLIPVMHILWRKSFYGVWLPNTYYAKYVSAWPESGLKYLVSFVIEYGLWFWLGGLAIWCMSLWKRRTIRSALHASAWLPLFKPALVIVALTFPFAYYTLVIGGDHFEYRVYSYLIPIVFVSFLLFVLELAGDFRKAVGLMLLFVLVSLPVQWVFWIQTQKFIDRESAHILIVPISEFFLQPLKALVKVFDSDQEWLIPHFVGMRHQEHKVFFEYQTSQYPPRNDTGSFEALGYPVYTTGTVGVPGWVFPNFAIIDRKGLNDFVIARNPTPKNEFRRMAHDRDPPPGYVECFRPNVKREVDPATAAITSVILDRNVPLTRDDIINCENRHWSSQLPATIK
jgi:arabinofuranosyltransferase